MAARLDSTDRKKECCLLVAWIWTFLKRVWISFLATVTKYRTGNNSRKKGQPIMVQKAGQQEYWAAGHIASHSRKQRAKRKWWPTFSNEAPPAEAAQFSEVMHQPSPSIWAYEPMETFTFQPQPSPLHGQGRVTNLQNSFMIELGRWLTLWSICLARARIRPEFNPHDPRFKIKASLAAHTCNLSFGKK